MTEARRRVRAAAVQFDSTPGDVAQNVARLLALCEQGARAGCQLLVLPEMATTGYCFDSREALRPLVETVPGPTTDRFGELAVRLNCYIVVGLPEVEAGTGLYYNTAALVGPAGLVGRMRKVHPDVWDSYRLSAGNLGFPVWDTPVGRIGVQICMDACYPESSRLAALRGVDILCLPTAWFGEAAPAGDWFTRAYENGVYLIAADRWGTEAGIEFSGGSCIIGPEGELLACRAEGDGLAMADLELPANGPSGRLAERRPEHYQELVQSRLAWSYRFARKPGTPGHQPEGAVFGGAAVQTGEIPASVEAAWEQAEAAVRQAAQAGARLVVLPELSFEAQVESAGARAEPIPGPSTEWAAALCGALNIYLVLGLAEQAGDHCYNTAVLVGPEGISAAYRKLHLSAFDKPWAAAGEGGWVVAEVSLGRIGLMIGQDAWLPEAARCLALREADVICAPSALAAPRPVLVPPAEKLADEPGWHLWRVRASENNAYLIFANRTDAGCMGASGIFGPDAYRRPRREAVVEGAGAGLACLGIDTRDYLDAYAPNPARTKDRLRMRNAALCAPLVLGSEKAELP